MRKWDTLTLVCLIVVAVLTPFELAFLEVRIGDPLFAINRVIDTVFVLDIILYVVQRPLCAVLCGTTTYLCVRLPCLNGASALSSSSTGTLTQCCGFTATA